MRQQRCTHIDDSILYHIYMNKSALIGDRDKTTATAVRRRGGWESGRDVPAYGPWAGAAPVAFLVVVVDFLGGILDNINAM